MLAVLSDETNKPFVFLARVVFGRKIDKVDHWLGSQEQMLIQGFYLSMRIALNQLMIILLCCKSNLSESPFAVANILASDEPLLNLLQGCLRQTTDAM